MLQYHGHDMKVGAVLGSFLLTAWKEVKPAECNISDSLVHQGTDVLQQDLSSDYVLKLEPLYYCGIYCGILKKLLQWRAWRMCFVNDLVSSYQVEHF